MLKVGRIVFVFTIKNLIGKPICNEIIQDRELLEPNLKNN